MQSEKQADQQEPALDQLVDKAKRLIEKLDQPLPPPVDLDQIAGWMRGWDALGAGKWTPADLQRPPHRLTWNAAVSALEALEKRGDLERIPGPALAWRHAQGQCRATVPGDSRTCLLDGDECDEVCPVRFGAVGHQLHLSDQEREALLALLDHHFAGVKAHGRFAQPTALMNRATTLRVLRERLRRTP